MLGLIALILGVHAGHAAVWSSQHEAIWDSKAHTFITLNEVASRASAGDIFVFGEQHATSDSATLPETHIHHANQVRLLRELQQASKPLGTSISVGMEFLSYTVQASVDLFRVGKLSETDFLKAAGWAGNPFEFYREQILFAGGGRTVALNIPGTVAGRVAKVGPLKLSDEERGLLPPVWQRGNATYFARFEEIMGGHVPAEKLENYFWAQSLWDDTMAWKALLHRLDYPNDILVIIVGEFHAQFGGGLPYELKVIGRSPVRTIVQIEAPDWKAATLSTLLAPDPVYGEQADYIWIHNGARPR